MIWSRPAGIMRFPQTCVSVSSELIRWLISVCRSKPAMTQGTSGNTKCVWEVVPPITCNLQYGTGNVSQSSNKYTKGRAEKKLYSFLFSRTLGETIIEHACTASWYNFRIDAKPLVSPNLRFKLFQWKQNMGCWHSFSSFSFSFFVVFIRKMFTSLFYTCNKANIFFPSQKSQSFLYYHWNWSLWHPLLSLFQSVSLHLDYLVWPLWQIPPLPVVLAWVESQWAPIWASNCLNFPLAMASRYTKRSLASLRWGEAVPIFAW